MKRIFGLGFAVALVGCDLCENEVLVEVPRDQRRAVVFERNCGASTPFNTQLSILNGTEALPDDGSNVIALPERGRITKVVWKDPTHLVVHVTDGKAAFRKRDSIDGVKVRYVLVPTPNP